MVRNGLYLRKTCKSKNQWCIQCELLQAQRLICFSLLLQTCLRLVPWCYAARSLIQSSQVCWLSISWLLLQPGRTDLALWRSWLLVNIMDAKRRQSTDVAPFLSGKHQWWLPLAILGLVKAFPILAIAEKAGQRFWQRSCKVRVELVEMTAIREDFLIKLLQRLQLWKCSTLWYFVNTAETGVLWRAEQWLERLCSSKCRHGKTAWWHHHIWSAH